MHIVELSTAIVKVDIKVINASLTQNQCLQCVTPPLTHIAIPRPRDTTELNNSTMTAWSSSSTSTAKQNRIYQFSRKRFNQRWLQFLFAYSFSKWLAVSCLCWINYPSLSVNGIFFKFSNSLVHWSISMIRPKKFRNCVWPWNYFRRIQYDSSQKIPKLCLNLSYLANKLIDWLIESCLEYCSLFSIRTRCRGRIVRSSLQ